MTSNIIRIVCQCGIVWKIPFAAGGKGLATYNFQCDGSEGCKRFLSMQMEDNNVKTLSQIGGFTV